jgi:6-phosphofructokinase 1
LKKIAVLTGGGDAPGLNAAIRAVVTKSCQNGWQVMAVKNGWAGLVNGELSELPLESVEDIEMQGGTILGTSRTNPYKVENGPERVKETLKKFGIDALIAIGGEDTLGVAHKLTQDGVAIVAIPKTIDNDLSETEVCIGFDTAVTRAAESVERLHTTAKSHSRALVVEIMGRHAGWITLYAGIAGGAHIILIPEVPFSIDEVARVVNGRKERGKSYTIVAVSEGAKPSEREKFATQTEELDSFGHVRLGGVAKVLAKEIEERTGVETRSVVLGHIQRSGPATAVDRVMATRLGAFAVGLVEKGEYGKMVSVKGGEITSVDVGLAVGKLKTVSPELYEMARVFFG